MFRRMTLSAGLLCMLLLPTGIGTAQEAPLSSTTSAEATPSPTFFAEPSYQGHAVTLGAGGYTSAGMITKGIADNSISSIRVPSGFRIQAFDNANFTGTSIFLTHDTASLAGRGFDNKVSSLRIIKVPKMPAAGLVALYPFTGDTKDASGNRFHCTPHGPVLVADRWGQSRSAYRFDGLNDFIECPNSPRLGVHAGVDITVSAWVKPSRNAKDTLDDLQIVSKYHYYAPETSDFYFSLQFSENHPVILVTGQGFDGLDGEAPGVNKWSHIAVVFRGSKGDASIYLNGQRVATGPLTYISVASPETLRIGNVHDDTGSQTAFPGAIDDVRIYEMSTHGDRNHNSFA